jgi:hypothetical protein
VGGVDLAAHFGEPDDGLGEEAGDGDGEAELADGFRDAGELDLRCKALDWVPRDRTLARGDADLQGRVGAVGVKLRHDLPPFGVLPNRRHQIAGVAFDDGAPGQQEDLLLCVFADWHGLARQRRFIHL